MTEKSVYYRRSVDGGGHEFIETCVFPSDGEWPARYAARGFSLTPPEDFEPDEDEESEDELDELGYKELQALAAQAGLTSVGKKKADLVAAIRAARTREAAAAATRI